jgi:Family of unknown function (DUF5681)
MSTDNNAGFKTPPKAHQFKAGRSGNPRGRPKGTRNLTTDLAELLSDLVVVDANGKKQRISRQQAVLLGLISKAERGDVTAARALLELARKLAPPETPQPEISEEDKAVVDDFLRCYRTGDDHEEIQ